jgi:hypothetical protein
MSERHWRWLTDLTFKRREEVHLHSPDARALFETYHVTMLVSR